ncbi:hypothetical protein BH11ARM1_BH11ARM1_03560 [soil metagenome]
MTPPPSRRDLLKASGAAILSNAIPNVTGDSATLGVGSKPSLQKLLDRGQPEVSSGNELKFIGMPVGGLFAGTVYLGGNGQLWNWDIFNQGHLGCVDRAPTVFMDQTLNAGGGANYVDPVRQQSPFAQHFSLVLEGKAPVPVQFGDVQFRGEYPIGRVEYSEADADVEMSLVAFTPFCPLQVDNSSFPATTLTFRITNTGTDPLQLRMQYQIDNPVLVFSKTKREDLMLTGAKTASGGVLFAAERVAPSASIRPPIVFEDWAGGTYGNWIRTGPAFGDRPYTAAELPSYMGSVGAETVFVVNRHPTRNGEDVGQADGHTGTLQSPPFTIARRFINMRLGGGNHPGETCVNLVVDGKIVRSCTGRNRNEMAWESLPTGDLEGQIAHLEVVERAVGGWGNIGLGQVLFSDEHKEIAEVETLPDFGTFCVEVVGGANHGAVSASKAEVGRTFTLSPKQSTEITFVTAWHFPNCSRALPGKRNWYASRWKDALAVAQDLSSRWPALQATTLAWNKTWYDSTIPYWFLDRTFLNTSILATTTCHRLDEGRFYFWEGIGCCAGTCTHVWGYAQAIGRVFPEIERYLRKEIDFGRAFHKDTGEIDYRAEFGQSVAHDGQASCILRAFREHQMSSDLGFLQSVWPQVKSATEYLIRRDANRDGILDGAQYNTLDAAWYGEIAWISSLYVAALRASEAMAVLMDDPQFARQCAELAEKGSSKLVSDLFNGEYFVNRADLAHPEANNTGIGCHIDQLYGQSWAHQVGLPRIVPANKARAALEALFKHNFYQDVWEYRRKNKQIPGGRWYATPKEGGLIMCSFPRGGGESAAGKGSDAWAAGYLNECMSGFEYQAASHMIAEGLVEEGMTVVHAIHQRYQSAKRNPYNEIECSDHYGRAMASYGAFVSLCGFHVDGPKHQMTFSPRVSGRFRCPFINDQGWGTFERTRSGGESVVYRYRAGKLSSA